MTEEARTLEAMKYAASMGYPSSMLKDTFAPFTIKRDVAMAQPVQEPVAIQISIRYKDSKGDEHIAQVEISRYEWENSVDDKLFDYKFQQVKHHLLAHLKEKKIDFKN